MNVIRRMISGEQRRPVVPPYPPKPWGYRHATCETDYGGYSCHHCFKCAPFSDKYPSGKHWPCKDHWLEFSWYCGGCDQVAHATWGASARSCFCPHCGFYRDGLPEDLDPLKQARLKLLNVTAENCESIAESLCVKAEVFMEKHKPRHQFHGTWRDIPEEEYTEAMGAPATTVNGYGMELDHPENIFRHKIYSIMTREPCTLENLLRVACYNAFLSTQREGLKTENIVADIGAYHAELARSCVPTTIMIKQMSG